MGYLKCVPRSAGQQCTDNCLLGNPDPMRLSLKVATIYVCLCLTIQGISLQSWYPNVHYENNSDNRLVFPRYQELYTIDKNNAQLNKFWELFPQIKTLCFVGNVTPVIIYVYYNVIVTKFSALRISNSLYITIVFTIHPMCEHCKRSDFLSSCEREKT